MWGWFLCFFLQIRRDYQIVEFKRAESGRWCYIMIQSSQSLMRNLIKDEQSPSQDEKSPCQDEKSPCQDEKSPSQDEKSPPKMRKVLAKMKKGPRKMRKAPPKMRKVPRKMRKAIFRFRQSPSPHSSLLSGHIYCNREIYLPTLYKYILYKEIYFIQKYIRF